MTWRADWASLSFMHLSFLSQPISLSLSHPSSLLAPTAPTLPLSLRWRRSSRATPPARRCAPPSPSPPLRSAFALAAAPRHRTRRGIPHPSSPPRPGSGLAAAPRHHPRRRARPPRSPRHPSTTLAAVPRHRPCRGARHGVRRRAASAGAKASRRRGKAARRPAGGRGPGAHGGAA